MTFDEIVDDVCERLNLTTADAITRVGKRVNRRYRRVTSEIGLAPSFRRVSSPFSVVTGTRLQTITGVEKIIAVVNASISNGTPLDELSYEEMLHVISHTGAPSCYAVKRVGASSTTLIFDTTFASATTLTIVAEEGGTTLSGSQVPAFPESYHDVLVFGALADELRKKEKTQLARDAEMEYERILGALRLQMAVSVYKDVVQGKFNADAHCSPVSTSGFTGGGGGEDDDDCCENLPINVKDEAYGAAGDGVHDDTAAIQAAITAAATAGKAVYIPTGEYLCVGLLVPNAGQIIYGDGSAASLLIRNANGNVITLQNLGQQLRHLGVRGEDSTPTLTGHNIVIDGGATSVEDIVLLDVDSRWCMGGASGQAVYAPTSPAGLLIDGGSYSHQGAAGELVATFGNTGLTAGVNYITITNMVTHKANQPWKFIGCAGTVIQGCQIGGIDFNVSTTSGLVTVNRVLGNRIIGDVSVLGSSHVFVGNALAPTYTVTFQTHATDAANGCVWALNVEANTATVTNSANGNNLIIRNRPGGSSGSAFGGTTSAAFLDYDPPSGDLYPASAVRIPNNKNYKQLSSASAELRVAGYNASNNLFVGQDTVGDFTSIVGPSEVYTQIGVNSIHVTGSDYLRPQAATGTINLGSPSKHWKGFWCQTIVLSGLSTFADNAAALAGGLVANDVYKTATGELRIVV